MNTVQPGRTTGPASRPQTLGYSGHRGIVRKSLIESAGRGCIGEAQPQRVNRQLSPVAPEISALNLATETRSVSPDSVITGPDSPAATDTSSLSQP
jgi:hypothetical protein